jgi:hypothetical protein
MKIRHGFVSNSSSSSFTIPLDKLTAKQLLEIQNHLEVAENRWPGQFSCDPHNGWSIYVGLDQVSGDTDMDNFSMREFLVRIGAPDTVISWGG